MNVDGPRPAVAWVTALPVEWVNPGDRHVLLVLALDTYDQAPPFEAAPSLGELLEWVGLNSRGTLTDRIRRLAEPVPGIRPALIEVTPGTGRRRTKYRLLVDTWPGLWSGDTDYYSPVDNPASGPAHRTTTRGSVHRTTTSTGGRSGPASGPVCSPVDRTTPYPLPTTSLSTEQVADRARAVREQIAATRRLRIVE